MAPVSDAMKQQYLRLMEAGVPRVEAAQICGEHHITFEILREQNLEFREQWKAAMEEGKRRRRAFEAKEVGGEIRARFLDNLRSGMTPPDAALDCGYHFNMFQKYMNPQTSWFDPEFKNAYDDAKLEGDPIRVERLRTMQMEHARTNYRAVRDLSIVHDPDWAFFRTQRLEVGQIESAALQAATRREIDTTKLSIEERQRLRELLEKAVRDNEEPPPLELVRGQG